MIYVDIIIAVYIDFTQRDIAEYLTNKDLQAEKNMRF